ncbi:MAG: hypothetical protein FWF29_11510 [Treponema sp.]|nr:hypothetical protein [Treponema sp.]
MANSRFDYKQYLDALAAYGLNYTRIYPGVSIHKPGGQNRKNDTLGPGEYLITPWARSNTPGYAGGGNKFDLDKWDNDFFARLGDFLNYANEKDIIVEICFFNSIHKQSFEYCPLHRDANVQGVGCDSFMDYETLFNKQLVAVQLKYVEKVITETNKYNNVIYEFCDEPTIDGTKAKDAYPWLDALITHATAIEDKLPRKHLFAQQIMVGVDFSEDDRIAINVAQYTTSQARQVGGYTALQDFYHRTGKPIEMNETVSALSEPAYYERDVVAASRLESWEFMVGGGAGFNQLNACFTYLNPAGNHPDNHRILAGLRNLRNFIESMDYVKMTHDNNTIKELSVGGRISGMSEAGKQYAFYMHHCFTNYRRWHPTHYVPVEGEYNTVVSMEIKEGEYNLTFVNPADLAVISEQKIQSTGEEIKIQCPRYTLDIALKIIKV